MPLPNCFWIEPIMVEMPGCNEVWSGFEPSLYCTFKKPGMVGVLTIDCHPSMTLEQGSLEP